MVGKIDIIPLQVLIEATIAEVTLSDKLSYGTQFFFGHKKDLTATLSAASTAPSAAAAAKGAAVGFASNFPGFVLAAGVRQAINAAAPGHQVKGPSAPPIHVW